MTSSPPTRCCGACKRWVKRKDVEKVFEVDIKESLIGRPYCGNKECACHAAPAQERNYVYRDDGFSGMGECAPSVGEEWDTVKYQLSQAILGALEYRGFYDAGKYLDESILERIKPVIAKLLLEERGKYSPNPKWLIEAGKKEERARVVSLIEGMKKEVPTNELRDVAMALRDPKTLSEEDLRRQEARVYRLKILHVQCAAHNAALSDLKAALEE